MPYCHVREHRGYELECHQYPSGNLYGPVYAGVPEISWAPIGFETIQKAERPPAALSPPT